MRLTESEAKEKWCPLAFRDNDSPVLGNRNANGIPVDVCIGSDCMFWRWRFNYQPHPENPAYFRAGSSIISILPEERQGYCGAAGKPE
jgi:hypothetical protein